MQNDHNNNLRAREFAVLSISYEVLIVQLLNLFKSIQIYV